MKSFFHTSVEGLFKTSDEAESFHVSAMASDCFGYIHYPLEHNTADWNIHPIY